MFQNEETRHYNEAGDLHLCESDAPVMAKCAFDNLQTLDLVVTEYRLCIASMSQFLRWRGDVIVKLQPSRLERELGTPYKTLPEAPHVGHCAIRPTAIVLSAKYPGCHVLYGQVCSLKKAFCFRNIGGACSENAFSLSFVHTLGDVWH